MTVWAGLMCTCSMDKLGKLAYSDTALLYKYKDKVEVPPLQMVDDVITASKCGNQVISTNAAVNMFTNLKKLKLSETKCSRLHIGKNKCDNCASISVNEEEIKESHKEKYLGDYLTDKANPAATILDRKQKGFGILSEITAILEDIPLGVRRFEIGMTLRQSWFINGTLYNSEVWCAYTIHDIKMLEMLDRKILRQILGAHAKVPSEMLHLETGAIPLSHVIAVRRLLYLQNILKKNKNEIVRQVYTAQKENPSKGDWINIVEEDKMKYNLNISDELIGDISKYEFKKLVKHNVREKVFDELITLQKKHDKVKNIIFSDMNEPQDYLRSALFTKKLRKTLFNLRCQSVKGIKKNFHNFYKSDIECPLNCDSASIDSQEHIFHCPIIVALLDNNQIESLSGVQYEDLFKDVNKQLEATQVFHTHMRIRDKRLEKEKEQACLG